VEETLTDIIVVEVKRCKIKNRDCSKMSGTSQIGWRNLYLPSKTPERVRDGVVINDDFSASQHLISQLNEPKKLEKLSLRQSNLVRILSAIRMGEVLSYEALEAKLREWENDILLSTSLFRGVQRSGRKLAFKDLLTVIGKSEEIDSLLSRVIRYDSSDLVAAKKHASVLLESAVLDGRDGFDPEALLDLWKENEKVRPLLLLLSGERTPLIREMIGKSFGDDLSLHLGIILKAVRYGINLPDNHPVLTADPCLRKIYSLLIDLRDQIRVNSVLVQFSFYGDPLKTGKGSSGGMGTFLRTLGNELTQNLPGVVTIVPLEMREISRMDRLWRTEREHHYFMYVPFLDFEKMITNNFLKDRTTVISNVTDVLSIAGISPGQFHLRFSDFASQAMLDLSKKTGVRSFFTVTPDPQRRFVDQKGSLIKLDAVDALRETSKVEVSWKMLRDCDRLFGIGSEESRNQLLAYYPPLLDESISKKLTMMPEGISLRNECPIFVNGPLYSMLFEKDKEFYLERSFRSNPLLLTVGRLDPAKGQVKLLKAWGNSGLWNSFNLVIVGGDLDHPNRIEANELEEIRKYVRQNKELHGRFCHLPAMNNDEIRCLENSISRVKATPWPPTYVAPSFKEEFGIAILEAMAAGFVAIAPKRGGVKSYIRDGYNGFLIDTTDEASFEKELRRLLIDARPSARRMKMIAENGSKTIYRRYSISVVAKQFSSYYSS
jgi:sucrose-phosphate synthase